MMSKYNLPKKFDYKDVHILKQFITETGKIIPARVQVLQHLIREN